MILHPTPHDYLNAKSEAAKAIRRRDIAEADAAFLHDVIAQIDLIASSDHRSPDWYGRDARRRLDQIARIIKETS